jgi:ketosteroid isomerase-like protein
MYNNTGAIIRSDINTYVLQAAQTENLLIGQKVLPPIQQPSRAGIYPKITIASGGLLRRDNSERAMDGSYNEINRKTVTDTYTTLDRGLEERVDDAYAADMSRFFDANVIAAKMVLRNMLIGHEIRCAARVFDPAVFPATNSTVAYTEANLATIDFTRDVLEAIDRLTGKGVIPNTMVLNRGVFNRLRRSARLQTYLYGNLPSGLQRIVTAQDIAGAFGLDNVYIAEAKFDTSKTGAATSSLSYIWSNNYVWLGNVQGGEFNAGGAGRTIVWSGDAPDLFVTETYRNEIRRGDMVRVRQNTDEKIVDETCAELITTQWA